MKKYIFEVLSLHQHAKITMDNLSQHQQLGLLSKPYFSADQHSPGVAELHSDCCGLCPPFLGSFGVNWRPFCGLTRLPSSFDCTEAWGISTIKEVHHDMAAPLSHYFIFKERNSCLTGNQLTSWWQCKTCYIPMEVCSIVEGFGLQIRPELTAIELKCHETDRETVIEPRVGHWNMIDKEFNPRPLLPIRSSHPSQIEKSLMPVDHTVSFNLWSLQSDRF
ncbi:hypothetical protein Salat_1135300 [Sesamum alatum]|uniref:Uncharacterized protein n=1 Tax=Sesamum alatum TaxID=300844 RepID=A0AAE2CN58_9LAMI|nr:hypothetical protein Salat_1135300 [Sesamum alatum]